jgi:glyoxylase-like metal-dependent hydrolase (beta-lactamase superfamily II)
MPVSRRQFITVSSAAVVSVPLRQLLWAQTPPTTRFETIRRNVGYFIGRGGTIGWLSNNDALIVVDTQFPDTAGICLQGLAQKSPRAIDFIFNTHHHADHTAGNGVFKEKAKKIVAHARCPELQKQAAAQQQAAQQTPQVFADVTFDETWSESAGDERATARHYGPGHTGGDAILHFERAQVVHMGDLLFHERHPFVDRPAGASIQNWMKTLETIMKEMPADTIYIAGHSKDGLPVALDRGALARLRDYFDTVLVHVRRAMATGASKEEIVKTESLPGFEGYQSSPPRLTLGGVLGVAYDELKG